METMENPSEDPPLDLEEYDDADYPINETENTEVHETVEVLNQPTTRVWMIEVAETDLPENSRKIISELNTRDHRINGSENSNPEETAVEQKQPFIEFRKIHLAETVLFEDNRKALNEQLTGLALNAARSIPVTVLKDQDHSIKGSETTNVRETVEVKNQLSNDVQVVKLAGTDLHEDNGKIFSELNKANLPVSLSIHNDPPIYRSENTEGTTRGQKEPPVEVPKIQGVDGNQSEDYEKAVNELKSAFDACKPFFGKISNRQDFLTKGSDTTDTDSSEGNRKPLTELVEHALDAMRTSNRSSPFSSTENNSKEGCIMKVPKTAKMQIRPIIDVRVSQVIETALPKDDCKAVFTERLTALALDAVRNYPQQNLNAQNFPINGSEAHKTTGWKNKPLTQVSKIHVMDASMSEDNRKAVNELKTALAGIRSFHDSVYNGQDPSTKGSDTTESQETAGVEKVLRIPVWVTQLVEIDMSQVSNEELQVALEAMRNLSGITSNQYPKSGIIRARKRRSNIFSTGLMVSVLATNIFAFVVGFGYGWWSRHALPTFSVYELHLDPTLF